MAKEICAHCGFVNCDTCYGAYDPHVPIEYHYRYDCTNGMRIAQRKKDRERERQRNSKPVDAKTQSMVDNAVAKAFELLTPSPQTTEGEKLI